MVCSWYLFLLKWILLFAVWVAVTQESFRQLCTSVLYNLCQVFTVEKWSESIYVNSSFVRCIDRWRRKLSTIHSCPNIEVCLSSKSRKLELWNSATFLQKTICLRTTTSRRKELLSYSRSALSPLRIRPLHSSSRSVPNISMAYLYHIYDKKQSSHTHFHVLMSGINPDAPLPTHQTEYWKRAGLILEKMYFFRHGNRSWTTRSSPDKVSRQLCKLWTVCVENEIVL